LAHEFLFMYTEELGRIRAQKKESRDTAALPSDTLSSIQQVIEYLNDRYMEDIHLDDLARRFFISRAYLTRSFRQMTGVTVVQYLTVVRIRRACQLLTETDEPVTEIARQCGFSNTTYFENVFRRLRGMTPSRYRKR
ncbi:MAG: helix-turn-helix transcriptional regulator, partial [Lachnospiraceae bacterium]|nr:helix-turn-helix transcriptional regulator [Lachnospiraceae bacterium]